MKFYERRLEPLLVKEIDKENIVVLTGMRQVGKTTLMKHIFNMIPSRNKVFLDMENPLNQKIFEEENFENIVLNLKKFGINFNEKSFVFIDEIQLAPNIVKPIKYLFDHYKIKFFLTGSSSFYLKNLFPESLAGRKIVYELFPLDFMEFLIFKNKEKEFFWNFSEKARNKNIISFQLFKGLFDEYITFGGFPRVVLEEDPTRKKKILEDIFKSYYEKDIKTLSDFKEIGRLRDLILLLSNRVGSKIEITKIASEIGVSRETIYSYLNFLEMTYFIFLIRPLSRSLNGEVRGARKVYFCDTGLLNYLTKLKEGVVFENAVFLNLKKYGEINYYQKYKGPEIDFILNKTIGLEVKLKADEKDIKKLKKLSERIKLKESFIVVKEFSPLENTILAQDL